MCVCTNWKVCATKRRGAWVLAVSGFVPLSDGRERDKSLSEVAVLAPTDEEMSEVALLAPTYKELLHRDLEVAPTEENT